MRTLKPQNVIYQSTNPGHSHKKYKMIQWHDRRRPHASQWPKPAYQSACLLWHVREAAKGISVQNLVIQRSSQVNG